MAGFFVKYREIDHGKVVRMNDGREFRKWQIIGMVEAADEATIRSHADKLSRHKLPVEIDDIQPMSADQERVFADRIELG